MRHEERWRLAEDLCARMARTYPDDLIIGGVYGSTAQERDTEWSDLELQFVVRTGSWARGRHTTLRGIAVGYRVTEEGALEEILTAPSLKWPFYMGVLSVLKVLYGDPERVQAWLRLGQSVPQEKFRAALEAALPGTHRRILRPHLLLPRTGKHKGHRPGSAGGAPRNQRSPVPAERVLGHPCLLPGTH